MIVSRLSLNTNMLDLGAMLGTQGRVDLIRQINRNAGSGSFFGGATDPFREDFLAFQNTIVEPIRAAGQMGDQRYSVVSLSDPEVNIRYGIWYLAALQKEFDGNDILALAAYNAGRGNVQSWMRLYGWQQDFSDVEKIPYAETREYVLRVLKYQKKYEDLYERSSTGVLTASIENR